MLRFTIILNDRKEKKTKSEEYTTSNSTEANAPFQPIAFLSEDMFIEATKD